MNVLSVSHSLTFLPPMYRYTVNTMYYYVLTTIFILLLFFFHSQWNASQSNSSSCIFKNKLYCWPVNYSVTVFVKGCHVFVFHISKIVLFCARISCLQRASAITLCFAESYFLPYVYCMCGLLLLSWFCIIFFVSSSAPCTSSAVSLASFWMMCWPTLLLLARLFLPQLYVLLLDQASVAIGSKVDVSPGS